MHERIISNPEIAIEFHHLKIMFEFSLFYLDKATRKPWEIEENGSQKFHQISNDYTKERTSSQREEMNYLKALLVDQKDLDIEKKLDYLRDVIGGTRKESLKNQRGMQDFFEKILARSRDKNYKFYLTEESDGICKSCIIGKHCVEGRKYIFEIDRDWIYKESVLKMIETDTEKYASRGKLGITLDNRIYLTAELLFNSKFHSLLEEIARTNYPNWIKGW